MLVGALVFLGLLMEAGYAGEREAKKLKSGELVSDHSPMANTLFEFDVKVAVVWVGSRPAPKFSQQVAYLGSSEGTTILFDTTSCTLIRVPSTSILLRDAEDETELSACPQRP
jgi:hypothetical protein